MSAVLHYMQTWLPISEQFVHALVTRSRHRAIVVSRERPENRTAFPHRPVRHLGWLTRLRPSTVIERRVITAYLVATVLRERARLVHHHHGYRLSDVAGVVRRLRVPLVVSLHGHDVTALARRWPGILDRGLELADAVVVPSRFLSGSVTALGVAAERIHVIPSGVDLEWFRPSRLPDEPRVVFMGRFVEKKGIDVLLKAWPEVVRRVPNARLQLVGNGPLESLARSGGPTTEVLATDPTRRASQAREAISKARVVVTPSRTAADGDAETLLLVNLEAQASGRPLVTTRHGGIPEFVDEGRTALVVQENDPDSLADALTRVLVDSRLADRLAEAGPAWVRRFDVAACTARMDDLYDSLLRR